MKQITVPASSRERVMIFLREFQAADNDAELEMRMGHVDGGPAAIVITLNNKLHGFTVAEARTMANIMEEAMRAFPDDPAALALPNLILALRHTADKAEAAWQ